MVHRITFVKNGKVLTDEETQMIIFQKLEELKQKNKEAKICKRERENGKSSEN